MNKKLGASLRKILVILMANAVVLTLVKGSGYAQTPDFTVMDPIDTSTYTNIKPLDGIEEMVNPGYVMNYETPLALSPHDHFLLTPPIARETVSWSTSDYRFGYMVTKTNSLHTGLDIPAFESTPILASGAGEVVFAGYGLLYGLGAKNDPYGIAVKIKHTLTYDGYTIYTVYAHLEKTMVQRGDLVEAGQPIGLVGMTGNTSGPHVHYEVRIQNERGQLLQNPELWLAPPLEHGVLAGRITNNMGNLLNTWKFRLTSLKTGQVWQISTYDPRIITRDEHDPYYQENYVLNDLPGGLYEIATWYNYVYYKTTIEIIPGAVNYVNFLGKQGFQKGVPPGSPSTDFLN